MKHKVFFLLWMALLACVSLIVGLMALLGYANAEVVFWTSRAIESSSGQVAWIVISTACLIIFSALAVGEYRKEE